MKKFSLYLETSFFNFVFADDAPEKTDDTLELLLEIARDKYVAYTSLITMEELNRAQDPKRSKMIGLIRDYKISVVEETAESVELAKLYVAEKMIPEKYFDDARHIALASIYQYNVIVSWNFKHIVKLKTRLQTNAINAREGYINIEICSPSEVIDNEKQ